MAFDTMKSGSGTGHSRPVIRTITTSDVFSALRQGLRDFVKQPSHYFFLCLVYPIMGVVIGVWTSGNDALPVLFPLLTGFALVGPLAALGLYEISRRRERGLDTSWRHAFDVVNSPSIMSIIAVGFILLVIFFVWLAAAQAVYHSVYDGVGQETLRQFIGDVLTTSRGFELIFIGNAVGFFFALLVLSISIVTFPLLLDRRIGAIAAMEASFRATAANFVPLLIWGLIVAALLLAGALTLFVGLAVVIPVLGHATWHLYRKLVQPEA